MRKISPDPDEIERLRKAAPPGPVVIVNLLRFHPGAEPLAAYQRYLETARDPSRAVEVLHAGPAFADVCDNAEPWDYVIIARWPSFDDFANGVNDPHWQASAAHRPAAIERTIMLVTPAGPLPVHSNRAEEQADGSHD